MITVGRTTIPIDNLRPSQVAHTVTINYNPIGPRYHSEHIQYAYTLVPVPNEIKLYNICRIDLRSGNVKIIRRSIFSRSTALSKLEVILHQAMRIANYCMVEN
jgi:hypothetical protein